MSLVEAPKKKKTEEDEDDVLSPSNLNVAKSDNKTLE